MVAQVFLWAVYKYFLLRGQRVDLQTKAAIPCHVHLKIQNLESESIKLWFETPDDSYVSTANLSVTNQTDHRHSFSLWRSKSTMTDVTCKNSTLEAFRKQRQMGLKANTVNIATSSTAKNTQWDPVSTKQTNKTITNPHWIPKTWYIKRVYKLSPT